LDNCLISSFINGLSAGFLSFGWMMHLGFSSVMYALPIGVGTFFYYYYCGISVGWNHKLSAMALLCGGLFVCFFIGYSLNIGKLVTSIGFIGVLFVYPVWLRELPIFKSVVISSCWTFFVLVLPIWLSAEIENLPFEELSLFWLLFYALTIPSDIRDYEVDSDLMRTLPQLVGTKTSSMVGMALITFFGLGYYRISESILLLFFSLITVILFGCFLRGRSKGMVIALDAMLLITGILFLFL
jgi:4-hydroxybenzoate polyprenyltransferase